MRGPAVRGVVLFAFIVLTVAACSVSATRSTSGTSGAASIAPAPASTASMASTTPQASQQSGVQAIGGRAGAMLTSGILVGNTLYLAGQLPGRAARDSGIGPQTKSAIAAAQGILKQAGMDLPNVVAVTVYLTDLADFAAMNAAYTEMFTTDPRPTRTTVQVAGLVNNAKIEVTMIAVRK